MSASIKPPHYRNGFEKSSFADPKSRHDIITERNNFAYAIDIVLPGEKMVPEEIPSIVKKEHYFLAKNVPLCKLIEMEFIEGFIKKGTLAMLSADTKIDSDDCIAVLPSGQMVLSLTKDTYEELGLDGKPSLYNCKRHKSKYVISLDLTADYFKPEKKNYKRTKWCFTERLDLRFDFYVNWVPKDDQVSPLSAEVYFESSQYECQRGVISKEKKFHKNIQVPLIDSQHIDTHTHCEYTEFHEWLGSILCGINCEEGAPDNFLSTFCCPEPCGKQENLTICRFRGFISIKCISDILKFLRNNIEADNSWFSMTVHGFQDSPVSSGTKEHGFLLSGDHSNTWIVFSNKDYWLYKNAGTNDECT